LTFDESPSRVSPRLGLNLLINKKKEVLLMNIDPTIDARNKRWAAITKVIANAGQHNRGPYGVVGLIGCLELHFTDLRDRP
jgi:hypothetical protein